jgi:hypothetical protein
MTEAPVAAVASSALKLRKLSTWPRIRVLAWDHDILYGCRGYEIVRCRVGPTIVWETVARFHPVWWRNITTNFALSARLVRDGFHGLAISGEANDQAMVGAVPGAIVTRAPGSAEFRVTHRILRGTRPLHITTVPSGRMFWGEYFDNRERSEVHIYGSSDQGNSWQVVYTFPAGTVRHVHNIIYDRWGDCVWILTGDEGAECRIMRASCELESVEAVLTGSQQARAVAAIPAPRALYLATDTPLEKNYIYSLSRRRDGVRNVDRVGELASSSIYGCRVGEAMFFSTMIEPSAVNTGRDVHLLGSGDGENWEVLTCWRKDKLSMRYFQYGNALLPDGENSTPYLATTTIAVEKDDLVTTLWEVEPS